MKDHYYQEYMEALRAKIDKQKLKIKKKEDILIKKINKREEKKVRSKFDRDNRLFRLCVAASSLRLGFGINILALGPLG